MSNCSNQWVTEIQSFSFFVSFALLCFALPQIQDLAFILDLPVQAGWNGTQKTAASLIGLKPSAVLDPILPTAGPKSIPRESEWENVSNCPQGLSLLSFFYSEPIRAHYHKTALITGTDQMNVIWAVATVTRHTAHNRLCYGSKQHSY